MALDPRLILAAGENDRKNSLGGIIEDGIKTYGDVQSIGAQRQQMNQSADIHPYRLEGAQIDAAMKKHELTGQLLSSAVDEPSYQNALKQAMGAGIDIGGLPPTYRPDVIENLKRSYMTEDQRLRELSLQIQQQRLQGKMGQSVTSPIVMPGADASPPDVNAIAANLGPDAGIDPPPMSVGDQLKQPPSEFNQPVDLNTKIANLTEEYTRRATAGEPAKNLQGIKNSIALLQQQAKSGVNKPPTAQQSNDALFSSRMEKADPLIEEFGAANTLTQQGKAALPGGNFIVDPQFQQFNQARLDFLNAVLRKESGAAISPSEFESGNKQYFPQPGDSPEVIQQKSANRKTAIQGIKNSAGPATKPSSQKNSLKWDELN